MKTRRGIYYDLEESPYITKFRDYRFYFSSEFYRNKFETNLLDYIKEETTKIKKKYQVNIDFTDILAFNLYRRIEKRGCYVIYQNNSLNNYIIKNELNGYIQIQG